MALLTIEELSERVGVTARNVRAYQSQGLVPEPVRSGRVALYDEEHVARVELIRDLRAQGFGLPAIERLVRWGAGIDPRELRAFAETLMHGLVEEDPMVLTPQETLETWGEDAVTPELLERSLATGFLRVEDDGRLVALSPTLRTHALHLRDLGMSFAEVIDVLELLHSHVDALASAFVELFAERVSGPVLDATPDRVAALNAVRAEVDRMRPWATGAVNAAFRLALARHVEDVLADLPTPDG